MSKQRIGQFGVETPLIVEASRNLTTDDMNKVIMDASAGNQNCQNTLPLLSEAVGKGYFAFRACRKSLYLFSVYPNGSEPDWPARRIWLDTNRAGILSAYSSDIGDFLKLFPAAVNETWLPVSNILGDAGFQQITGNSSGATGILVGTFSSNHLILTQVSETPFQSGEGLTGSQGLSAVCANSSIFVSRRWMSERADGNWMDRD